MVPQLYLRLRVLLVEPRHLGHASATPPGVFTMFGLFRISADTTLSESSLVMPLSASSFPLAFYIQFTHREDVISFHILAFFKQFFINEANQFFFKYELLESRQFGWRDL
jgi:hypothetical protein